MEAARPTAQADQNDAGVVPERYEELVARLGRLVERLEGGGLSLEDSISAFEEGVRLARAGATRLDDAERRVELLLEGDRTKPFEPAAPDAASSPRPAGRRPDAT